MVLGACPIHQDELVAAVLALLGSALFAYTSQQQQKLAASWLAV